MEEFILSEYIAFDWDHFNSEKNWNKHGVSCGECEEIFFNEPLLLYQDTKHSINEKRIFVLGKTNDDRKLFLVFTERNKKIRIISARDMSKKERNIYEQT